MATSPTTDPLLESPLLEQHRLLGAKLVPFAGWRMPLDYGSILTESRAVRQGAGLFDVSHMARFLFHGATVAEQLDHALGGSMVDQPIGKARYTMLLAEDGGILDDLITYRTAEDEFLVVVNAANRAQDWDLLVERLEGIECADITEDGGGILALQGPDSARLLAELSGQTDFCPHFLDLGAIDSPMGELFLARTGYTGEHGYEIFASAEQIVQVWEALVKAGAEPVGLGARDVLRLEAAMPLYGHEIHEGVTPFDVGMRFAIRGWKTRDFVGAEALRELGDSRLDLIGLSTEKRVPREGYKVLCDGREVGTICSGVYSATLDRPIATALVEKGCEGPFQVDLRGKPLPAEQVALPFVPHRSRD